MNVLMQLFISFFKIGLFSIGGGYAVVPLIQEQIVTHYHLMSMEEFADLITIAEMTPGPITLNAATFVGNQVYGFPGAILCTIASLLPSFLICLLLAYLYYRFRGQKAMHTLLGSLRPAVIALITSAGLSILALALLGSKSADISFGNVKPVELAVFLASFILLRRKKTAPVMIIFGSGIAGVLLYQIIK